MDRGKSKEILKLNKHSLSLLIRNITGHAHLDRHRKVIGEFNTNHTIDQEFLDHIEGVEPDAYTPPKLATIIDEVDVNLASNFGTCRLCGIRGNEETPHHIALSCPYTWRGRAELHGMYEPTHIPLNWDPAKLAHFYARYDAEQLT